MDFSCKLPSDSSTSSEASRTHAGANMMISASSSHVDEEAPTACITQFSSTSPPPIPPAEVEKSPATEASTSLTNPQALNVLAGDSVSTESQEDDDCNVYLRFLTPPTESDITLSGSSVQTYHAGGNADTERDLVSAPLSPQISDPQQLLFSQSISRQQNFSRSTTSSEQPVGKSITTLMLEWCAVHIEHHSCVKNPERPLLLCHGKRVITSLIAINRLGCAVTSHTTICTDNVLVKLMASKHYFTIHNRILLHLNQQSLR